MFGTLFDKVQTLLSRTFWLGNFFPVFVFALLNLALAWLGIDGFSDWLASKWTDVTVFSAIPAFGLIAVAILAFAVAPLIPTFRRALEGEFLPPAWREPLRSELRAEALELQGQERPAERDFGFFDVTCRRAPERLSEARNDPGPRNNLDPATYTDAIAALRALRADVQRTLRAYAPPLPPRARVIHALDRLTAALRQYPLEPDPANPAVATMATALTDAQTELPEMLRGMRGVADRILQGIRADLRAGFVLDDIRPTRLGSARAAMERYPAIAYLADYDFLWPRLNMVMGKNDAIKGAVEAAQAQLDFAVLMTVLAAVTAIVWPILLALAGSSIVLFAAAGILLPALTIFFYRAVQESQRTFGAVMQMAVDGLRFDLLTALHQRLPPTMAAEQATWGELQYALHFGNPEKVRFRHPKS
jgi:hypothetical protein